MGSILDPHATMSVRGRFPPATAEIHMGQLRVAGRERAEFVHVALAGNYRYRIYLRGSSGKMQ